MKKQISLQVVSTALFLWTISTVLADGKVSGRVTSPEGKPLPGIKVVLVPEEARSSGRLSVKTNKDGKYLFGIVPNGRYTLTVEETDLAPYSINLIVYDTDKEKNLTDYEGPPPTTPQAFEVGTLLKVSYDLVLGDSSRSPAGEARRAREALARAQEVPALLQSGDFQGALGRIDEALKSAPEDPNLHYYRGYALFQLKDTEKAKGELERSLQLKASLPGAHFLIGSILRDAGKKTEALAEFKLELGANPDPPTRVNATVNIGLLERELGHKEEAISAFEKILELDPKQLDAYALLNELYLATGHPEKAAEVQDRAKHLGVEDPAAVFNLGASYWNSKDYARAAEYFHHAVELDPRFAPAWKNLGYSYVNLDKTQEAIEAFKKYLELAPGTEDAKEIQELIAALSSSIHREKK